MKCVNSNWGMTIWGAPKILPNALVTNWLPIGNHIAAIGYLSVGNYWER